MQLIRLSLPPDLVGEHFKPFIFYLFKKNDLFSSNILLGLHYYAVNGLPKTIEKELVD